MGRSSGGPAATARSDEGGEPATGQAVAEPVVGPGQSAAEAPGRSSQLARGLVLREPFQVQEDHGEPFGPRQPGDLVEQGLGLLAMARILGRIGCSDRTLAAA